MTTTGGTGSTDEQASGMALFSLGNLALLPQVQGLTTKLRMGYGKGWEIQNPGFGNDEQRGFGLFPVFFMAHLVPTRRVGQR